MVSELRASALVHDLPTDTRQVTIPRTPENMVAWWHNTSQAYLTHHLYEEALERNAQALAAGPKLSERWMLLMSRGNILMPMGRMDEGLTAFDEALTYCKAEDLAARAMVLTNHGSHLSLAFRFADAEKAFAQVVREAPDNFVAWYSRARNEGNWAIVESQAEPKNYASACAHASRGLTYIRKAMQINASDPDVQAVHARLEQLERTLCNASAHVKSDGTS